MSERERWIVYPLLFFALGAALRDKVLQRVDTKEVLCESVKIIDHQDPTRLLAELSFQPTSGDGANPFSDRVGTLRLIDREGKELCNFPQSGFVQQLSANLVTVSGGPNNSPLVVIGSEPVPGMMIGEAQPTVNYEGVVYLSSGNWGRRTRLAPPPTPRFSPPEAPKLPPADPADANLNE